MKKHTHGVILLPIQAIVYYINKLDALGSQMWESQGWANQMDFLEELSNLLDFLCNVINYSWYVQQYDPVCKCFENGKGFL